MSAQHRYFQAEFRKLDIWFGKYQEIWFEYFSLDKEWDSAKDLNAIT